jgi:hypothetical protein
MMNENSIGMVTQIRRKISETNFELAAQANVLGTSTKCGSFLRGFSDEFGMTAHGAVGAEADDAHRTSRVLRIRVVDYADNRRARGIKSARSKS